MSIKDGKDYIYLIWKDIGTRKQYVVGQLSKNGQFEFRYYEKEVNEAIGKGFELLIPFPNLKKTYMSDILFPIFSSRLPDKKRRNIKEILLKYGLSEYDDYKLLKRSGARLPIDNLEFIDPILDTDDIKIKRIFYLAGPRHYIGCDGCDCLKSYDINKNDFLDLIPEPENQHDPNAIRVFWGDDIIGYIPRYYCKGINSLIKKGYKYTCRIYEVQKKDNCNECIKIDLELYR